MNKISKLTTHEVALRHIELSSKDMCVATSYPQDGLYIVTTSAGDKIFTFVAGTIVTITSGIISKMFAEEFDCEDELTDSKAA